MRVRFKFCKLGKVRWTSHRDLARMWERAFRRAQLPIEYTGGFSPRPKVSFGLALPTGHESVAEYLDADLRGPVDVAGLPALLSSALPVGVDVTAAAAIDDRATSLQQEVTSCTWLVRGTWSTGADLERLVAQALGAESLVITRQRKGQDVTDDVRPGILSLVPRADGVLECELATQPRGLRPAELLLALDPALEEVDARRTHQWIQRDGARGEPLDATDAPHAELRAS